MRLLLRLDGHVFHVTDAVGLAGILRSGAIKASGHATSRTSQTAAPRAFGPSRGYVCLVDLRAASPETIRRALDMYYFLDPFSDSTENAFLILAETEYPVLIPNHVGVNAAGEAAVPEVEVWYPGSIPLSSIENCVQVPIRRPDPWEVAIDWEAFRTLFPGE